MLEDKATTYEIEYEILRYILANTSAIKQVYGYLQKEDFVSPSSQNIFEIIIKKFKKKEILDIPILRNELKKDNLGIQIIEQPTFINEGTFGEYLRLVKENKARFDLDITLLSARKSSEEKQISFVIADLIKKLQEINLKLVPELDQTSLKELIKKYWALYIKRKAGIKEETVSCGFPILDYYFGGGFGNGELILIGSRPSIGKTALALTFAYEAAKNKKSVLFCSIEMKANDLLDRLTSFETGIPCSDIIRGEADQTRVEKALKKLEQLPLKIIEMSRATSYDIANLATKEKYSKGLDLLIIDYLQYLSDPTKSRGESEAVRIGKISRNLKTIASFLDIPVICPCQLSRKPERREDKVPQLDDLRESGNLEQDADIVLLLHRPESENPIQDTIVRIAKNRKGQTASCKMQFNATTTKFSIEERRINP